VVLGREQRADVSVKHEVRLHPSLDGLLDRRIGGVDEVAHPVADVLLPVGFAKSAGVVFADEYAECLCAQAGRNRTMLAPFVGCVNSVT
jgi:hypothetical protein